MAISTTLTTYYNGASSFLSALVTFLTAVQGNEIITHEAPSNWVYGIGVGISFLTGVLSHLKQAQPAVDSAGDVAAVISDIENVLDSFRGVTTPTTPTPAAPPSSPAIVIPTPVTSAVNQATNVVQTVTKTATDIVDEVAKVIATYKLK